MQYMLVMRQDAHIRAVEYPQPVVLIVIVTGVEMSWIWMFAHIGQITDPNIVM